MQSFKFISRSVFHFITQRLFNSLTQQRGKSQKDMGMRPYAACVTAHVTGRDTGREEEVGYRVGRASENENLGGSIE